MSMFKVGQTVRVREGLRIGNNYDGVFFNHNMKRLCGAELKVIKVISANEKSEYFTEGNEWKFSEGMLEFPLVPSQTFEVGESSKLEIFVERVIANDPATILFYRTANYDKQTGLFSHWSDTKKVVAKVNKSIGDVYDVAKGLDVAHLKAYRKEIDRLLRKA